MMKSSTTIIFLLFTTNSILAQEVEFFREDLTFRLEDGFFAVEGDYFFRNTTDREVKKLLFYPLPESKIYGDITSLNINLKGNSTSMITGSSEEGAAFKLKLGPGEEATYRINYVQKLRSNEARYIITTTRHWGKGLEFATYRLDCSASIFLDSISIIPDTIFMEKRRYHYLWDREDFMPEVDFIFQFSKSSGND
jgi:hypothetical protein